MSSLEQMRGILERTERLYLMLQGMERYVPSVGPRLDFLERKITTLRRNIDEKSRRIAQLRSRVMQDPYLGRYARSFNR